MWRQENWGVIRRNNETNEIITSSFSWTDLGWREAESRTATVGKHKWFPQTLFFFFQIWQKMASFTKCKSFNDCSLLHSITTPPVWVSSASSTLSQNLFRQILHQQEVTEVTIPENDMRLCPYMATGMRGWICFPQLSQRMLIWVQGFSRDNGRLLFLFSKGLNYTKPKEWFNRQQVSKSQAMPQKCF